MHCVESQVEKPGVFRVAVDESERLAPESVGKILLLVDRLDAAQNGIGLVGPGVEIGMSAAKEAEVFAEAALHRMELRFVPQVPLADQGCDVARRLEPVGQCLLSQG